jgi:hypothetical protein
MTDQRNHAAAAEAAPALGRHGAGMSEFVSILIPCFDAERWIGQAIESALAQTYMSKEIIVVDDGSSSHGSTAWRGRRAIFWSWLPRRLAELGWVEGQNFFFDCVSSIGRLDELPALAALLCDTSRERRRG